MTRVRKPPPSASIRARLEAIRADEPRRLAQARTAAQRRRACARTDRWRRQLYAERDALIESCLRVPWFLANKFRRANTLLDRDDLAAAGNVGLVEAAELFDPTRGVCFSTYTYRSVWSHIVREAKRQSRRLCVPELPEDEDAPPAVTTILSLDWRDDDDKAFQVAAPVAVGPEPDERAALQVALRRLPARDREVLDLRFAGVSLKDTGTRLGICRERVRQIEQRALAKLRGWLAPRYGRVG